MVLKEGSDRYMISFPPGLKERADAIAKADGRTLNNWLVQLIERAVYANMKAIAVNVQVSLDRDGVLPNPGDDLDQVESVERLVKELEGRISAAYPSANSSISWGPGNRQASVRVHTFPATPEIEHMVKRDIEAWLDDLLKDPDAWLVKKPGR